MASDGTERDRPRPLPVEVAAGGGRGTPIMGQPDRSCRRDEWRRAGRGAVGVPRHPGVRGVVEQGEGRVELRFPDAHERALLGDRLGVEAVERQRLEDVRYRRGLEHDLVAVRWQLDRVDRGVGLGRGAGAERGAVDVGEAAGRQPGRPVGAVAAGDAGEADVGTLGRSAWPAELANPPRQWWVRQ